MMDRYIRPGDQILDIGGGPGHYAIHYAKQGHSVTLLDLSDENIRFAKKKARQYGVKITAEGIPGHSAYPEGRRNAIGMMLLLLKELGVQVGLSIKPGTPKEALYPYLHLCDMILVMSVEPGYGGQKLIPETLVKLRELKEELARRLPELEILNVGADPTEGGWRTMPRYFLLREQMKYDEDWFEYGIP